MQGPLLCRLEIKCVPWLQPACLPARRSNITSRISEECDHLSNRCMQVHAGGLTDHSAGGMSFLARRCVLLRVNRARLCIWTYGLRLFRGACGASSARPAATDGYTPAAADQRAESTPRKTPVSGTEAASCTANRAELDIRSCGLSIARPWHCSNR